MTKETFLECVNNVDEDLIESVPTAKKRPIIKYGAIAAGVAVAVLVAVFASKIENVSNESTKETKMMQSQSVTDGMAFNYSNNVYRVAKSEEFLLMNSLPQTVSWDEVGDPLAKNIVDITGNNVLGDLYTYKNSGDLSTLVLKQLDGNLALAVEEEIYE